MKTRKKEKKKANIVKTDNRINYSLFSPLRFLLYFAFSAFMISTSFLLFFEQKTEIDVFALLEDIPKRAWQIFFYVISISIVFTLFDAIKRNFVDNIPIKKMLDATEKITNGDFNTTVHYRNPFGFKNEIDTLIENFNKMSHELSSIETLKTDFIANVSHELKTPLSVIQNYSTMLQAPGLTEAERSEYAKHLESASKKLNQLISDILRLNKLENQQITPNKETYNLSEQLCETMILFEKKWEEKELNIETEMDESIEITADKELLHIVWSNLISNAIKFNKTGGLLFVGVYKNNDTAVVEVRDTGCGINEQTGVHIFEKFYQGDTSHSTSGNGLGLALVKRVIDLVHGEISVESKLGKGSIFKVSVPINQKKEEIFYGR